MRMSVRYEDRTLVDKDGNKSLRFIPFAVENGEPDFYVPMGSTAACISQALWRIFRTKRSLSPTPCARDVPRRALAAEGAGPHCRHLLAFDDDGYETSEII